MNGFKLRGYDFYLVFPILNYTVVFTLPNWRLDGNIYFGHFNPISFTKLRIQQFL